MSQAKLIEPISDAERGRRGTACPILSLLDLGEAGALWLAERSTAGWSRALVGMPFSGTTLPRLSLTNGKAVITVPHGFTIVGSPNGSIYVEEP